MAISYPKSAMVGMKTFSLRLALLFPIFIASGVNFLAVQRNSAHANYLKMWGYCPTYPDRQGILCMHISLVYEGASRKADMSKEAWSGEYRKKIVPFII